MSDSRGSSSETDGQLTTAPGSMILEAVQFHEAFRLLRLVAFKSTVVARRGVFGDRSLNYVDEVPFISQHLIDHYSAGPSASRVQQVKSMHEDIRKVGRTSFSMARTRTEYGGCSLTNRWRPRSRAAHCASTMADAGKVEPPM